VSESMMLTNEARLFLDTIARRLTTATPMAEAALSSDWTTPLVLSLMAGLSTCLGAAVVFVAEHGKKGQEQQPRLGHQHLSFSLSLAGSVMITVSTVSILPECFHDDAGDKSNPSKFVSVESMAFWQRCIAFSVGCALYMLLSKFAFPEPDAILGFEEESDSQNDPLLGDLPSAPKTTSDRRSPSTTAVQRKRQKGASALSITELKSSDSDTVSIAEEVRVNPTVADADDDMDNSKLKTADASRWSCFRSSVPCSQFTKGADLSSTEAKRSWRVAMLLFVSLAVHNFPEGLAVAASAMHSPRLGVTTAIAIALHNIPEGIAIAIPCLAARPDAPWLAFWLASLSGLAEPFGAIVALTVLDRDRPSTHAVDRTLYSTFVDALFNMKNTLAFVAGIMIMVALIELYPEAKRHMKTDRMPGVAGTVLGVVLMLASEAYLDNATEAISNR
jgi:zinc transporter, ZIP family